MRNDDSESFLDCPACGNAFEPPPRDQEGVDVAIDLSFSHIPKILSGCLHTVCQSCAEEALQRSDAPSSIPCPFCDAKTTGISTTGSLTNNIVALQDIRRWSNDCDFCHDSSKAARRCIDCESLLCAFHAKSHSRSRSTKEHKTVNLKPREVGNATGRDAHYHVPVFCPRHEGVRAKLFCSEPCGTLMCHDCSVAEHSGHTIFLADSEEVELKHRTGLTRHMVNMGRRLATVQGAVEAVHAAKTGLEESTRIAEKAAAQAFSKVRRAVDFREKSVLKNLRGARASNTQELNSQLAALNKTVRCYTAALEATRECLDRLQGDQLLAMEPTLRKCLDTHEAQFPSLVLEPCVDNRVEFAHDRDIVNSLRMAISKVGCIPSTETGLRNAPDKDKSPEESSHAAKRDVHFTLAAIVGTGPQDVAFTTPSDTVVVEMRSGSEQEFLATGAEGPVIGRVILHTKLRGANNLAYESEQFFESLSRPVLDDRQDHVFAGDDIPTVRFTKTLRVSGR